VKACTQASVCVEPRWNYDSPSADSLFDEQREMGALEMARIIHADPMNAALLIIALGDGSQRALMKRSRLL